MYEGLWDRVAIVRTQRTYLLTYYTSIIESSRNCRTQRTYYLPTTLRLLDESLLFACRRHTYHTSITGSSRDGSHAEDISIYVLHFDYEIESRLFARRGHISYVLHFDYGIESGLLTRRGHTYLPTTLYYPFVFVILFVCNF